VLAIVGAADVPTIMVPANPPKKAPKSYPAK